LALASKTSNAKPYAIRGHFSHRKRSGIRRKRVFSGLFAVSGYRRRDLSPKFRNAARLYPGKLPSFGTSIEGAATGWE
jgi:hypothetical protein